MPFPYPGEYRRGILETLAEDTLHLREIHADGTLHPVTQNDISVITIRLEVDNLGNVHPEELITGVEI